MPRVALVTGAARGIGAASVRALAAGGWSVIALDRCANDPRLPYALASEAELNELAASAGADGQVVPLVGDASDPPVLARAVALAEERFGGLDGLVAAAGVIAGGVPQWELEPERERAVLEVDLYAVLAATRACIPALLRRPEPRHGRIIAIASVAAVRGLPMLAAYCAAKAGVTGLVRALGAELRGTGITANAINPGSTDTHILAETARLYDLGAPSEFASQQPIERLLTPEEVAAAVAWLAGEASGGVTGAVLAVDGGLSL